MVQHVGVQHQECTCVSIRNAAPTSKGIITVRIRLWIKAITSNVMASEVARTKASIRGMVKIEIMLEDMVSKIDIAVLAPTACITSSRLQ